jgi:hypothetical protein
LIGPASAQQATVTFAGWAFEPQVVEANVKVFMDQNKDLLVKYTPLDLQLYNEKMIALFNAGTEPDCFYVRDSNLGAWVEAGWVQPIDGLPKLDELNKDIFPFNLMPCPARASSGTLTTATLRPHVRQESPKSQCEQSPGYPRRSQGGCAGSEEGRTRSTPS